MSAYQMGSGRLAAVWASRGAGTWLNGHLQSMQNVVHEFERSYHSLLTFGPCYPEPLSHPEICSAEALQCQRSRVCCTAAPLLPTPCALDNLPCVTCPLQAALQPLSTVYLLAAGGAGIGLQHLLCAIHPFSTLALIPTFLTSTRQCLPEASKRRGNPRYQHLP